MSDHDPALVGLLPAYEHELNDARDRLRYSSMGYAVGREVYGDGADNFIAGVGIVFGRPLGSAVGVVIEDLREQRSEIANEMSAAKAEAELWADFGAWLARSHEEQRARVRQGNDLAASVNYIASKMSDATKAETHAMLTEALDAWLGRSANVAD